MKRRGDAVTSAMGGGFPRPKQATAMTIGGHSVSLEVRMPGSKRVPTPTQTAGSETRPSRPGTKQFPYGKNST